MLFYYYSTKKSTHKPLRKVDETASESEIEPEIEEEEGDNDAGGSKIALQGEG